MAADNSINQLHSIKLGLLAPLTGIVEMYGPEICWAAQIATDMVNEKGGLLGRPLELVIADDGSIPETAVPAASHLITEDHCSAIIGNLLSNSRISVAYQVAEPQKVPYLNFSFYEGSIYSPYFFSFSALPNQQIDKMIPYMLKRSGPKVYFAGSDYEWPRGSIDAAKRSVLLHGGEIIGEEYFPLGELDASALVSAVGKSGADVFVPYFAGHEQLDLLTLFSRKGLKSKMAVVMGHYDEAMASHLPAEVRRDFYSSNTYFMSVENKANEEYLARLKAHQDVHGFVPNGNGVLTNFGEGTFTCVMAYANAVNQAGSLDTKKILEALKTVTVEAPQGVVTMDAKTQHAAVHSYLARCRRDGVFEIVEDFGRIHPVIPKRYQANPSYKNNIQPEEEATSEHVLLEAGEALSLGGGLAIDNRMAVAMNIADIAVVAADTSGAIVQVNKVAEEIFGYQEAEIVGQSISVLIPPRFRAQHHHHVKAFAEGKKAAIMMGQRGDIWGYRKDGQEFPAEASIAKMTGPNGTHFVAMLREMTKYKRAEEALQWQASHDALTELPNRSAMMERLSNALRRSRREGGDIALLFIDLDDFKLVNDNYGHAVGDQLLVEMADRLLTAVRGGDTVARFGGDEFVILCERLDQETSVAFLADRINTEIRRPITIDDVEMFPSCSIGIAVACDGDLSAKDLLSNADAAMYQAKESGRDGWMAFNAEIQKKARERLDTAVGLRSALSKGEMHCVFQPIVNTDDGSVVGVETLLRWVPETGPVSPDVFIPVAEMSGMIGEIGAWVFEQACQAQVALAEQYGWDDCPYVSINVSPRQLDAPDFFETICRISSLVGANSKKILIEVTETALMADMEQNVRVLKALGAAGFGIAIDDFGTGYSSLSLLTKLPLTVLKVDRAFVTHLETSEIDRTVATAVIGLAHSLNLKVVAEGVETEDQRDILRGLQANFCQGYLFSKPILLEELLAKELQTT